jgi:hypothetical protein
MKSLVFNGNGCTVYGADGGVAFRVDNYGCRGGREVFLMDRAGKTLIRIQRKGLPGVFRRWEACRCSDDGEETTTPWFRLQSAKDGCWEERSHRDDDAPCKWWQRARVHDPRVHWQIGLPSHRRWRRGRGGGRAEADAVRGCAGGRCPDADGGGRDGSSARLGFGGHLWPDESELVMAQ